MNIEFKQKKIYIDNEPIIIMAGEIHYFRLKPSQWQHAIDELKAAGMNTVASYIPWVIHEQIEGDFDLDGKYKEQYNLNKFLDLVLANDLYFIPRPGPYTMAEMVGDGIPPWVSEKHPDCKPETWNGVMGTTVDLDYLHPGFLSEAKKWYSKVIPVLAKYQGKNLLGVQLDNEMGMLAWVSNCPVLNDNTVQLFIEYLHANNLESSLEVSTSNFKDFKAYCQNPEGSGASKFHDVLLDFYRHKIKVYTEQLEEWCYEFGLEKSTIYMINVHGTGGGGLYGYPIGLSQLYKSYENKSNYLSGSDIYFDSLSVHKIHDTYLSSAMTEALNSNDQPLTSLEFNSSDTDFGFDHGRRALAVTNNHRGRLLLGQGTKLFNFYLFTGGFNDFMNQPLGDGIDRIASTGEKHGYGAPIRQDMTRNYIFDQTAQFGNLVKNLNEKLSSMLQIQDKINIAFIPDYFKNEFVSPDCKNHQQIVNNIKRHTMDGSNEVLIRYLLLRNYMPTCINVQDKPIDRNKTDVLVVNSARYMAQNTQLNLADFLASGGKLIMYGQVPEFDLTGNPCTVLRDKLKLDVKSEIDRGYPSKKRISLVPCGFANGLAATFREQATPISTTYNSESFIKTYDTQETVGLLIEDEVTAAIITCAYRCDMALFDRLMTVLNVEKKVTIDTEFVGINATLLANENGEMFLNAINLDDIERKAKFTIDEMEVDVDFEMLDAIMMPINIQTPDYTINVANQELYKFDEGSIIFRLSSNNAKIIITTDKQVEIPNNYHKNIVDNVYTITTDYRLYEEQYLTIRLK